MAEVNATSGRGPRVYERHDPASQALHRVVRENLATFYAAIEQGWESGLPEFVRAEFSRYLACSVLQRGFTHLAVYPVWWPSRALAAAFAPRASLGA